VGVIVPRVVRQRGGKATLAFATSPKAIVIAVTDFARIVVADLLTESRVGF
jgi:hypothetical protein